MNIIHRNKGHIRFKFVTISSAHISYWLSSVENNTLSSECKSFTFTAAPDPSPGMDLNTTLPLEMIHALVGQDWYVLLKTLSMGSTSSATSGWRWWEVLNNFAASSLSSTLLCCWGAAVPVLRAPIGHSSDAWASMMYTSANLTLSWNCSTRELISGSNVMRGGQETDPAMTTRGFRNPRSTESASQLNTDGVCKGSRCGLSTSRLCSRAKSSMLLPCKSIRVTGGASDPMESIPSFRRLYFRYNESSRISSPCSG